MAGKRKTRGQPCCSAEPSSKPWLLTFNGKMLLRYFTGNGQLTGIAIFTIPSGTAGIACCNRVCSCSSALPKTIALAQGSQVSTALSALRQQVGERLATALAEQSGRAARWIDALATSPSPTARQVACLLLASRYPEEPAGLLALDPQLACYSWVTGIADVAQVVFVRKRLVEIQYFRTVISHEQREEFGHLVQDSIQRIESAEFLPHSGIRFPQNPCTSCSYIGLCLGRQDLTEATLVRRPGADDLGWLDELAY